MVFGMMCESDKIVCLMEKFNELVGEGRFQYGLRVDGVNVS